MAFIFFSSAQLYIKSNFQRKAHHLSTLSGRRAIRECSESAVRVLDRTPVMLEEEMSFLLNYSLHHGNACLHVESSYFKSAFTLNCSRCG